MIRRRIFGAAVLASLVADGFQTVYAQDWTQLTSQTGVAQYPSSYFLNANVGFKFNAGITWDGDFLFQLGMGYGTLPELVCTSNGGITWSALNFFDTSGYSITQLSFVSLTHGYASATPTYNGPISGGIFETFDQGSHWKKITSDSTSFSGVYATKHVIFASEIGNTIDITDGEILYSRDDGVTWDSITKVAGLTFGAKPQFQFIYGNRDSLVATIYFTNNIGGNGDNGDTYLVFSTDLGNTWNSSLLDQSYQMAMVSLHISPHSCNIVRECLVGPDQGDDTYSFLESSPPYNSWGSALMHRETGAWIAGTSCESYLSDAADGGGPGDLDSSVLLFRSTDEGVSWKPIHKEHGNNPYFTEMDDFDWQNLSVVGYGAVIYADDAGSCWKSTDGGDGALSAASLAPQLALAHAPFPSGTDTLNISQCSPSQTSVFYQNLSCAITTMDSVSLIGLAPNQYSLTSTYHNDCLSLPDSTYIAFTLLPAGIYPITIHYHFTDDEYNTIDTSLSFILDVQPGGTMPVPVTLSFQSPSMNASPGDTISVPVYLSGLATLGGAAITLPFGVDTNILVPVGFQPAIAGMVVDTTYYSNGSENISLSSANIITINGSTLVGYLRCLVYLADTLTTAITLPTASLNSSTVPCVALSLATDSIAVNIVGCGTKTLQQFMLGNQFAFGIMRIVPNPASNEITIIYAGEDASTHAMFTISDPLGRSYTVPTTPYPLLEKEGEITLDISSLPSGVYFVSDGVSGAKFVKE